MDSGTENTAASVKQYFLTSKNLTRVIAQVDIKFSNSMIEAFFKSLKHNYLYFQKLRSQEDVYRKIKFYIEQHNHKIPKMILKGATPLEAFKQTWFLKKVEELKRKRVMALEERKKIPQHVICKSCS